MSNELFNIKDKVVAITGGCGILGSAMATALIKQSAHVALMDLFPELDGQVKSQLKKGPGQFEVFKVDVLNRNSLESALKNILNRFKKIDALINGAGGNHPQATTSSEMPFMQIPMEAFQKVLQLNLTGTLLPSQVFADVFIEQGYGNIINISSMNAIRPLTRIPAYSAAKAAVSNFTQWLAVHLAQEYNPNIRVNAIAPGFFLTKQNRFLLLDEQNQLTERGKKIIDHTPMGRFGQPEDLFGTMIWLLSDASSFVTGTVIPVDGGFAAFSGV
ncbi:MAG TPA: SDR family oxidoreductase [Caldithrix abyssi]|uniref:SDR family oxidoreductase n=1 Tax=Caldithrix abyssi TaxID=187145 RepID=A0A7V5H3L0_CALAY|nr:SDR family oxidoreductase [Caldisericaceae bacterium]HHE55219.1 SDR family oxidoreductase [Caldithrix abyssi]